MEKSGGSCNGILNIINSRSYIFVFAGKIMKYDETLESVGVKKENSIFWIQNKESKFNGMKQKILKDHGNDFVMKFKLKDLNLDPFMINPRNENSGFQVIFNTSTCAGHPGLKELCVYVADDEIDLADDEVRLTYRYKTVRDRIRSYSFLNRLWMFWSTLEFDWYRLTNICILVFPNENKIEIRELYHNQRILETFVGIKNIKFYPKSRGHEGGAQDLFHNLVLIPPSMTHNSVLNFWKNKELRRINIYHIFVLFLSIFVLILSLALMKNT